jgi:hypothetical protein
LGSSAKSSGEERTGSESHPHRLVGVRPGQACIRAGEFLMWKRLRRLKVELFEWEQETS